MKLIKFNKTSIGMLFAVIIVACYFLYGYYQKRIILNHYNKTQGILTNYYTGGLDGGRFLEYEYVINGTYYKGKASPRTSKYDFCEEDIEKCLDKKFWVIYSVEHYSWSLIDLTNEIQGMQDPLFPKTLENFE